MQKIGSMHIVCEASEAALDRSTDAIARALPAPTNVLFAKPFVVVYPENVYCVIAHIDCANVTFVSSTCRHF